jgi:hypothetical protein
VPICKETEREKQTWVIMLRLFVSEKKLLLLVHSKGANKNVIHKAHRRIQFIRQQKKL